MQLRPYQRDATDAPAKWWAEHGGNPLVVIPTAGGKSLIIAQFVREALEAWPDTRVIILTHVKELISQNFAEMVSIWPQAPAGIYSAGIGLRQINAQVLFAGIQSIHKRAYQVQRCDLVLIDEAHLIPRTSDTMYRRFLRELTEINPYLKVVGFTATPYRLDSGMLHKGPDALFDGIAYEISVRKLIDDGYLSPVITLKTDTQLDVAGVGTRGGEFIPGQLEAAVDLEHITKAAVREIVTYGHDRRSWLVFGSGIKHCQHIAEEIRGHAISAECIFGETPKADRNWLINDFKSFQLRCLVSMGVLTTGFNAPSVDLLAMLRPTKSTGLYVQIVGRGTRVASGKDACLVLDFAGNIRRHGPIDLVAPEKTPGEGDGEAPVKACPECEAYVLIAARECEHCGYEFPPPETKIAPKADTAPILSEHAPQWVPVTAIDYERHTKSGSPDSLRVTYHAGLVTYREWICLQHTGFAREKAAKWWQRRAPGTAVPASISEALESSHALAEPREIAVRRSGKYHEIVGAKF
jgi:DNA repair protein RadD